jgi:sigma54-dependent transcription regulator
MVVNDNEELGMQTVRQIVDAEQLTSFMDIPEDMRNIKVEIIVLPVTHDINPNVNHAALEKVYGSLHDYAAPAIIQKEKNAWRTAVIEKVRKRKHESCNHT